MNHSGENIFDLVTPFVDDELSEELAVKMAQQIKTDPKHRRLVAAERALKNVLATRVVRRTAPAALKQRIQAALQRPARPSLRWFVAGNPTFATAVGALAVAIALTIVVLLFNAHRITPFVEDVYAHHIKAGSQPVHIKGDYETVAAKTTEMVGFPVPVPRLNDGCTLEGACKCCLCGRDIAFIRYVGAEGLITLFIIPKAHPALQRLKTCTRNGMIFYVAQHNEIRMAFWREEDTTYCLACSASEDCLINLACQACRQIHESEPADIAWASSRSHPATPCGHKATTLNNWE